MLYAQLAVLNLDRLNQGSREWLQQQLTFKPEAFWFANFVLVRRGDEITQTEILPVPLELGSVLEIAEAPTARPGLKILLARQSMPDFALQGRPGWARGLAYYGNEILYTYLPMGPAQVLAAAAAAKLTGKASIDS